MAPIPPNFDAETTALIASLRRSSIDISDIQIPRLRDCKGPVATQQAYAAELRESLDEFETSVELLDGIAEDMTVRREKASLKAVVEEFRTAYTKMRKDMRLALLHSKKAIDLETKNNREELFKGALSGEDKRSVNEKATDDALMQASNSVTDALRRTIDTMQRELERSVLSQQLLDQSTTTLQLTSRQHDTLSYLVDTSRTLITALEKADWMDRLIIGAALAFFVLVVLFILKQRIVDRGLRLAFWWVKWVPGLGGGGNIGFEHVVDLERGLQKQASVVGSVVTEATKVATTLATSAAAITASASSSTITSLSSPLSSSSTEPHSGRSVETSVKSFGAATPATPLPTPPTRAPGEDTYIADASSEDSQLSSSPLPETTTPTDGSPVPTSTPSIAHEEL